MIRKIALAGAAGAIALGGLAFMGGGAANAATPTLTGVTSANIACNITAKATLVPALKNNWVKSQHASDPNPAVVALPDTQFAALNTPNNTSSKAKGTCSGNVTGTHAGGSATMAASKVKIELTTLTNSVDNPPLNNNGGSTCTGLLLGTAGEDVGATYKTTISLKGSGAKLATFEINGSVVTPAGLGFSITGGSATGPMSGATGVSQANADGATIGAIIAGPATSAAPKATSKCQASLKAKAATPTKPASASLKAPKGLKKLVIASGTFNLTK